MGDRASFAAALLRQRPLCIATVVVGGAHLAATAAGLSGWICPFKEATGLPCPGCGMTRASVELLSGNLGGALHLHPFAPLAVVAIALVLAGAVLPNGPRDRLLEGVARIDRGGRISGAILVALIIFWIARLALDAGG